MFKLKGGKIVDNNTKKVEKPTIETKNNKSKIVREERQITIAILKILCYNEVT